MATKVIELELTRPFPFLQYIDVAHYSKVQILVRKNNQPLGYAFIQLQEQGGEHLLEEKNLRTEIERQIPFQSNDVLNLVALEYDWPTLTVAVCTRGRPQSLEKTLESLIKLDYPADKIDFLLVENVPTDNMIKDVVDQFPPFRRVIEMRPGINWARNCAIKAAQGEIIAFTDDDARVDSLWAKGLARHFSDPKVGCVTGLIVPAELETEAQIMFEEYGGFGKGFEKRHYSLELARTWDYKKLPKSWQYFPLIAGHFGATANAALRKSIFEKTGFFDESLGPGTSSKGAGDSEMFYRIIRHNFTLIYEPQAIVWHYHRRDIPTLRRQIKSWGQGTYAFWTKAFLHDPPMRTKIIRAYPMWFFRRILWQIYRRKGKMRQLPVAEMLGALQGTVTYFIARREADKLIRRQNNENSH